MRKSIDKETRRAVDEVIEQNLDYLVRFAMFRIGNRCDAEDIVYGAVLSMLDSGRLNEVNQTSLRMYLYRIVYNRCCDHHRYHCYGRFVSIDSETLAHITDDGEMLDAEEVNRLNDILDGLPTNEAEVVRMNLMDELTFAEISRILDIAPSTVKSRFKSGITRLKAKYFKDI